MAQKKIDALFCAGSLSAQLAQGARDGGMEQVFYFAKRQELIEHLDCAYPFQSLVLNLTCINLPARPIKYWLNPLYLPAQKK